MVEHGKGVSEETAASVLKLKMVAKSELLLPERTVPYPLVVAAVSLKNTPPASPTIFLLGAKCVLCTGSGSPCELSDVTRSAAPDTNGVHKTRDLQGPSRVLHARPLN